MGLVPLVQLGLAVLLPRAHLLRVWVRVRVRVRVWVWVWVRVRVRVRVLG